IVGAGLIGLYWRRRTFGWANTVTLLRVIGTSWAAGLMCQGLAGDLSRSGQVLLVVVGSVCLVLDGVDGRVARGRGEVSAFGARFDMETDAALNLFLGVTLAAVSDLGWWVVACGALRYLYVAASWVVPPLRIPLDYRYVRKVIAVVQAVALLASLMLDLLGAPLWVSTTVVAVALASLCWSFGRDVVWQFRHR
ncbi:MAG: CDP-alcohol phosphatidyltransferase family protein, partial [Propionibacteriaceae bacterium]